MELDTDVSGHLHKSKSALLTGMRKRDTAGPLRWRRIRTRAPVQQVGDPTAGRQTRIGNSIRAGTAEQVAQAAGKQKHAGSSAPTAETHEGVDNAKLVRKSGKQRKEKG